MADVAFNFAIVGAHGRILELAITPQGEARMLVADVPLGTGDTPYARLGDWLGWLSLAGMIVFAVVMTVTAHRIGRVPRK